MQLEQGWDAATLETGFKEMAAAATIKPGDLLMPLRIMLVGAKFGPGVFDIAALLGGNFEATAASLGWTLPTPAL